MTALAFTKDRDEIEDRIRAALIERGMNPDDKECIVVPADGDEELIDLLVAWQGATNVARAFLGLYAQTPELPATSGGATCANGERLGDL